jgi:hypothetical protein
LILPAIAFAIARQAPKAVEDALDRLRFLVHREGLGDLGREENQLVVGLRFKKHGLWQQVAPREEAELDIGLVEGEAMLLVHALLEGHKEAVGQKYGYYYGSSLARQKLAYREHVVGAGNDDGEGIDIGADDVGEYRVKKGLVVDGVPERLPRDRQRLPDARAQEAPRPAGRIHEGGYAALFDMAHRVSVEPVDDALA